MQRFTGAYAWYVVGVLTFAYMVAFIDRQILSLLVQPIRHDLGISDTQISLLAGFAFAIFYSILGVPIARLADRRSRRAIISIGVFLWSLMTAACGLAKSFTGLFVARVGVGVGEAALSPAAYSIMADYFPPQRLARAIAVYAMGLYLGAGLAMIAGSAVVRLVSEAGPMDLPLIGTVFPWQLTFFVVALPGLLVLLGMATVREPKRREFLADGSSREATARAATLSEIGGFFRRNLRFIFAHFAGFGLLGTVITAFMVWTPELLRRSHGMDIADAGLAYGILLLVFGTAGPYAGGWTASWLAGKGYKDCGNARRVDRRGGHGAAGGAGALGARARLRHRAPGRCHLCPVLSPSPAADHAAARRPQQPARPGHRHLHAGGGAYGYTVGPVLVALMNDYVFRDDAALGHSLAIVSAALTPIGTLCLWYGMKPYRERDATPRWNPKPCPKRMRPRNRLDFSH